MVDIRNFENLPDNQFVYISFLLFVRALFKIKKTVIVKEFILGKI